MASRFDLSTGALDVLIENAEDMAEEVTKELFTRIKARSPVDKGDYKRGWKYEVDGRIGWIYNTDLPLEKLRVLEEGSSIQSPQGVVRPSMSELPDIFEDYLRKSS